MIDVELIKGGTAIRYYIVGTNLLHREDGPAVIYNDGGLSYYQYNKLHRVDGPAVTYKDGSKRWLQFGKLHRLDGPAYEPKGGGHSWHIEDVEVNCSSQEEFEQSKEYRLWKLKAFF